ncbi:MAG TPA: NAD(+) synthase [Gemmata sp.]|jgi:NAD+ synthase (glutamine-hydrolysing)|nr:NAD(+) synthase [Gemmata sp.]
MDTHGFIRVATASPDLRLADCPFNADRTLALMARAEGQGVNLIVFPECGLTGYTCNDLFHHQTLLKAAEDALSRVAERGAKIFRGIAVVGLPLGVEGQVYNCAAAIHDGKILGIVPKTYLPNYKEFYDARYFCPADSAVFTEVFLNGESIPFGTNLLFDCRNMPGFTLAVEICEDLWMPVPPSSLAAVMGATVFANLSASNEVIGKASYRQQLVMSQSGRCLGAYLYAGCGVGESSTDIVFGGHCLIAENGVLLAESERFSRGGHLLVADIDLDRMLHDRMQANSFHDTNRISDLRFGKYRNLDFELEFPAREPKLLRTVEADPFVPKDPGTRDDRCREIFQTQVAALGRRLSHVDVPLASIGVSGGLDSTLALLVLCKTLDDLGVPRDRVRALTMPGFGTTERTKGNALALMRALGVSALVCDIRAMCFEQMKALGHSPFGIKLENETVESLTGKLRHLQPDNRCDLVFENVQARVRTSMLMNSGFVIGTGDLSELAVGWCTYNADHISMYNPNVSIPKTLVRFLVKWAAEHEFEGESRETLLDVAATEISPELLPTDSNGRIVQTTESSIGPYELVDFFLYHFLRFGARPEKILFLAQQTAFETNYTTEELRKWLRVFLQRFFANQFKRSCLPDGPKVGSVSLSPRGDWRMPSDAAARVWLDEVEKEG